MSVEMKWKCDELMSLTCQETVKLNKFHRLSQKGSRRRHPIADNMQCGQSGV